MVNSKQTLNATYIHVVFCFLKFDVAEMGFCHNLDLELIYMKKLDPFLLTFEQSVNNTAITTTTSTTTTTTTPIPTTTTTAETKES